MKNNIFISYAGSDTDIVENLREKLSGYGVTAWVYSLDNTLANDMWDEIKEKIIKSDLIIFAVSKYSSGSLGQKKELELVIKKVTSLSDTTKIMPIFIDSANPQDAPLDLIYKNGIFLDRHRLKSVALKIAKIFFPFQFNNESEKAWKCPTPGEWLEVSDLDGIIEGFFDLGDKLYFRSLSPIGQFECYAPKIKDLYWIAPENVKACINNIENNKRLENDIPRQFTINGMLEIQRLGWEACAQAKNAR